MKNENRITNLTLTAERIRRRLLKIVYGAKAGHIGGDLSCINVLTVLYFDTMNVDPLNPKAVERDRFIMSKGHCVEALYSVLEARGFISSELTNTYGKFGSLLAGHPTVEIPGVEINSGALGHGLSVGVGMAIGAKMNNENHHTFVLMGDGEQGEGSIYEAAMAASHYKLDNLVAIIDRNRLQISDTTENVMAIEPIRTRWESLGWDVLEADGDNIASLVEKLDAIDYGNGKPSLIISHATKGCGVSLMENKLKWHHGVPSPEEFAEALSEIDARIEQLK